MYILTVVHNKLHFIIHKAWQGIENYLKELKFDYN
jgi:hypothetical protein